MVRTLLLSDRPRPGRHSVAAPTGKTEPVKFISLKGHTNVKLDENLHSDRYANNNLKSLPTGKQKFGDVEFEIGDGLLQLGSSNVDGKPKKIEGIKVGRAVKKLHFLQASGYSAADDTVIGKYVIHYDDKTTAEIEIVYRQGRGGLVGLPGPDRPRPRARRCGRGRTRRRRGSRPRSSCT